MHFAHQPFGQVPWLSFDSFLKGSRLKHLEPVLEKRDWLAGSFSAPTS
jgi:hypothetical protein